MVSVLASSMIDQISIDRALLLTKKPLYQGFLVFKFKSSLNYNRHHELVNRYGICVSQMATNHK
jgi:hypothetical protein